MRQTIDSRGHFWWNDDPPVETTGLPQSTVAGRLTIDERGKITLELDGVLSEGLRSFIHQHNTNEIISDKTITGLLYEDSEYVALSNLRISNSFFGSASVSREKLEARYCLFGSDGTSLTGPHSGVDAIQLNLANLSEWLKDPGIRVHEKTTDGECVRQTFEYERKIYRYPFRGGYWSITFDLDREISPTLILGHRKLMVGRTARLDYVTDSPIEITRVGGIVARFQEFFAVVTGAYVDLGWPRYKITSGAVEKSGKLYYSGTPQNKQALDVGDLWTFFPKVCDQLGILFESFNLARDQYGPGIYLYLACLRTESMFAENRFTTLVTGLESLYRRDAQLPQESKTESETVDRILCAIQEGPDRKWLERTLKHRAEIGLETKLFRLFKPLAGHFSDERLKAFAKKCADLRNDVTHFGGLRGPTTYEGLLNKLGKVTPALSNLYHALLLMRIGFSSEDLKAALTSSPAFHVQVKGNLIRADLLDSSSEQSQGVPPLLAG